MLNFKDARLHFRKPQSYLIDDIDCHGISRLLIELCITDSCRLCTVKQEIFKCL